MRKILIQAKSDRQKTIRLSTVKDNLALEVYYLDHEKKIRRGVITLLQGGRDLTVCLGGSGKQETYFLAGNPAQKLN
jgi:hypothetical protein